MSSCSDRSDEDDHSSLSCSEKSEACHCAAPYFTTPTLLDLQHMKNRLNVAQVGKELMQWNSSNTGIELKKISADLQSIYKNFGRQMRDAFLLLSRCRYFNDDFYRTTTENVKLASMVVECSCTTVAGVNIIKYTALEVPNTKVCKCPFLCRGGQAIQEAKKAWTNLLKSHIKMVELRTNFLSLEAANRNATKRFNIISQIVVPKTQATINYILVELEEATREESNRIKVKSCKIRNGPKRVCSCTKNVHCLLHARNKSDDGKTVTTKGDLASVHDILESTSNIYNSTAILMKRNSDQPTPPLKDMLSKLNAVHDPKHTIKHTIDSIKNFYEFVSKETMYSQKRLSLGDFDPRNDLKNIDKAEDEMDALLAACQDTSNRLKIFNNNEKPCQVDTKLTLGLNHLKGRIDTVIEAKSRLGNSAVISQDVKQFIKGCEEVDNDLRKAMKDIDSTPFDKSSKKQIQLVIKHIDDVVKLITDFRSEGLLTPSLEEFSKVCEETKVKIGGYKIRKDIKKIDHLKDYVSNLESLTADITSRGVKTASLENFLTSCRGMKEKLEEHKQKNNPSKQSKKIKGKPKLEDDKEDVLTKSVQKFIKSCEDVIRRFQKHEFSSNTIFGSVYNNNVVRIAKLMTTLQNQGLLTKSTIAFLTGGDRNKNRINKYNDENNESCSTSDATTSKCRDLSTYETDAGEKISTTILTDSSMSCTIIEKTEDNTFDSDVYDEDYESKALQAEKYRTAEAKRFSKRAECNENRDISGKVVSFNSSGILSDVIVGEISTYNSCPVDATESYSFNTLSSDSWTKPLIPKSNHCIMCLSNISSATSSGRQICEICEKMHPGKDIKRAIPKIFTL